MLRPPNILFIMADQFRHDYLSCRGATHVPTPNIDALAARGIAFTQCITNAPVCAPARTALATGLQPARMGHLDNHAFLPLTRPTMYQRLRDHGYRVGCAGKLDLAKPDPYNGRHGDRPLAYSFGFTHPVECEGKMHAGSRATPLGPYTHHLAERGLLEAFAADYARRKEVGFAVAGSWDSVLPTDAFEDVYIGQRSVQFLDTVADDFPWFFFTSFVGPHDPFDPPAEYAQKYRGRPMPAAIPPTSAGKPAWSGPQTGAKAASPEQVEHCRRQYCAAIEVIDVQVGQIIQAVERRGQLDNTVIIFCSDHGEMLGDHGRWTKSVFYESALRVPLILAGPGIPRGAVSDALVELIDLNPTCCEIAQAGAIPDTDALSLLPLLRGQTDTLHANQMSQLRTGRCLRTRQAKLIESADGFLELYDLTSDPDEQENLAASQRELARSMQQALSARWLSGACLH